LKKARVKREPVVVFVVAARCGDQFGVNRDGTFRSEDVDATRPDAETCRLAVSTSSAINFRGLHCTAAGRVQEDPYEKTRGNAPEPTSER